MSEGAIDRDWSESERAIEETLAAAIADKDTELSAGSIAIDLVTRQLLYIHKQVSDNLVEYYEKEGFDLNSYKSHPYLPVTTTDAVYECVFIAHDPQQAHNAGKTYAYPRGRLMKVPLAEAWEDDQ